ncbi:unnamed protein product [Staurois parvus]|uniref:Secreted protein n=1 Tax=Staurois parvus TaxID=386267 RepID=A0ABN9C7S3_9NEOB|nr:unnamed protein product [Staurois parvus]
MGPCTASSCCCQVQSVSWSLYGLPLLLSLSPHSAMCHFQVSSHTAGGFHFCHRVLYGLPLLLPPPPHTVAPHSGFGPVTAQMMKCAVILRSTALICMSY